MKTDYLIINDTVLLIYEGRTYQTTRKNSEYGRIVDLIEKGNYQKAAELFPDNAVQMFILETHKNFAFTEDALFYNGELVSSSAAKIIISELMSIPADKRKTWTSSLMKFLEKLMKNPSAPIRDYLFSYIELHGLSLTSDGDFLAYKAVDSQLRSIQGNVQWVIGEEFQEFDTRPHAHPAAACHAGYLHIGCFEYAQQYAKIYMNRCPKILVMKTNPEHVLSIPDQREYEKITTWKTTPIAELYGGTSHTAVKITEPVTEVTSISYHNVRDSKGRFVKQTKQ